MTRKVGAVVVPRTLPKLADATSPKRTHKLREDAFHGRTRDVIAEREDTPLGPLQSTRQSTLGGILGTGELSRPAPSKAWSSPDTVRARLAAVVAHQNVLREKRDLPLLDTAPIAKPAGDDFLIPMPKGFDGDETTAGAFNTWGDLLMRAVYGDLFSLNQVYRFEGERLVDAIPYAQWLLEQLPGGTVTLHRQMSDAEAQKWKSGGVEGIGSDWGHGTPVVHFSTDHDQTSAAGSGPTLTFTVPKAELLAEAKRGAVWSSATELPDTGKGPLISELVLPSSTVERWLREEKLTLA